MRLPVLIASESCPATPGTYVSLPGTTGGYALGSAVVRLIIGQEGDLAHGIVYLGASDVRGWYGIKTDWAINPSYSGWAVIRAEQLNGDGPIAALGEATIGPVIVPPGPTANTFDGWRYQPSGIYVRGPGCYGFQIDGTSFREQVVVNAVFPP